MKTYIGIDLGTSGIKGLLVDEKGRILSEANATYPCYYPQEGYSEQDPKDWYEKCLSVIGELLKGNNKTCVKAISFGGQMHGLVMLDKEDNVLRPAILWNDGRATEETEYLNQTIGKEAISAYTGNIAFAGFTAPKILWVYHNEREKFNHISKIMLPKDYLIYRLSGVFATDLSDASGMLLLDVKNRKYSKQMLDICHISEEMLPELYESYEVVGTLREEIADMFELPKDVKIIAGAGDNAAAAIGTGTIGDGACNLSLGTSGTIFLSSERFSMDSQNALHSFCDASGKYHLMGCILSAASCRSWWLENIIGTSDYKKDEEELSPSDVIFLPYLMGERSPHNDVNARGAFINLSTTTTKGKMSQAVLEGVAFALRDCLEIAKENGVIATYSTICGGGARSAAWRQIIADVFNLPIQVLQTNQGPSFGAAILAMVGDGVYQDVAQAVKAIIKVKETILPQKDKVAYYQNKYRLFKKLYPALKSIR